ncbi:hypothetical protein [Burkholderia ubonensis]|nr:hypothetical protein [Burkholderia ubonensis]
MLLDLKRPADALKEYEASMQTTPNRLRGLYGAATAADLAQDRQKAKLYYGKLVVLTREADSNRAEVRQAKLYLDRH